MRRARAITALGIAAAFFVAGCPKQLPPPAPTPPPSPAPLPPTTAAACKRITRIEVQKSQRKLTAECVDGGRLEYPIALARERGPKRAAGDSRMPEGEYQIAGPARISRFHRFIPFDYPSRADAERALAEGRIDRAMRDAVVEAQRHGRIPPQDTPLGGELGIHGEGPRWRGDLDLNWTEGCIAVTDQAIEDLSRLLRRGTPIRIVP